MKLINNRGACQAFLADPDGQLAAASLTEKEQELIEDNTVKQLLTHLHGISPYPAPDEDTLGES